MGDASWRLQIRIGKAENNRIVLSSFLSRDFGRVHTSSRFRALTALSDHCHVKAGSRDQGPKSVIKPIGDAVLSRDGSVELNGKKVGYWWIDGNDLYHFDQKRPAKTESAFGVVTHIFRHELKIDIAKYFARVGVK